MESAATTRASALGPELLAFMILCYEMYDEHFVELGGGLYKKTFKP